MKILKSSLIVVITFLSFNCLKQMEKPEEFKYQTDRFADLAILRYKVPGFEKLSLKQKKLVYYLYMAALSGRDIFYDQNYRHNLLVRKTLEAIVDSYKGDRKTDDFGKFMVYAKLVWFSNGIHHHHSNLKMIPDFSEEYFAKLVNNSNSTKFPLAKGETIQQLVSFLTPIIFDPKIDGKKVNLIQGEDLIKTSAVNFYGKDLTQKEVENFYLKMEKKNDPHPIWYGLNSKLVKENGKLKEDVWKVGGMYSPAIEKIVYWLTKASSVAENDLQKRTLDKLIEYYKTGDLKTWDEYNILWTQDTLSRVDAVNGFIEVYNDPLGRKGSYESIVSIKDFAATKTIAAISKKAQWFEDHSPILEQDKKKNVVGISAKVITVVVEMGDASTSVPIGINLPNSTWIRKDYGSKSVMLGNIVDASNRARTRGLWGEFYYSKEEVERAKKYGPLGNILHTDLHEVIGHASGQIEPGIQSPKITLKNYASAIEEARADLVALYYAIDPKLVEIGVTPSIETGKAEYDYYILNGLMLQLRRIKPGEDIEEAHMRNRQMICKWVYEKGMKDNIIEKKIKDGKTYFVINDYQKLRKLFGQLLREVQRITSQGDFDAAKNLIETYGVKVDTALHKEVLGRWAKLHGAPYKGFINPKLVPVYDGDKITDVKIEYPNNFSKEMMDYSKNDSFLPVNN